MLCENPGSMGVRRRSKLWKPNIGYRLSVACASASQGLKIVRYIPLLEKEVQHLHLHKVAYRKLLEDLVNKNGGEYRGNLTKDVTHLIARVPSGTKHTYACEWGIKIVSAGWLMQSVERGMILEENLYNLLLPESERGQNAWVRKTVSSVSLGKRARDDDAAPAYSRKLRRTASAKLSSQNDYLWSDIVNKGMEAESIKGEQWDGLRKDITNTNGIIKVETNPPTDAPPIKEEPNTPKRSSYDVNRESEPKLNRQNKVLFRGKSFYMHGFDAKQVRYTLRIYACNN